MNSTVQEFQGNLLPNQNNVRNTSLTSFSEQKKSQINQLRGGGCICDTNRNMTVRPTSTSNVKEQTKETIQQFNEEQQTNKHEQEENKDKLIKKNIDDLIKEKVRSIIDKMNNLTSDERKNEIVLEIQWFIFNRQKLIRCCTKENFVFTSIIQQIEDLLDILPKALQINWFICYEILQICNDLVRILSTDNQKNPIKADDQQRILEKLKLLNKQLDNVSPLVWKTGLQFEITLLQIMFTNCITDSTEGKDLLKSFVSEALMSIVNFKISDDLIKTTFQGIRYLFKKSVEKLFYPIEVYQVYYLFQILKFGVIYGLKKNKRTVIQQIQNLQQNFANHIMNSDKWILHFCWINLITELILYRPSIKKQKSENIWSQLAENQLIQNISQKQQSGLLVLFQNNEQLIQNWKILDIFDEKLQNKYKYKQIVQFLLQGELISNFHIWNYYKNFSLTNNNINSVKKDYEIILITDEVELLNKYIHQFQEKINTASLLYEEIQDQSESKFFNEKIKLEHSQKIQKKYVGTWAEAFILLKMIREFTLYEITKVDLLHSCFEKPQNQLVQPYNDILESINQLNKFEENLLDQYFSLLKNIHRTETQVQTQTMKIDVKSIEFQKFTILCDNLNKYKTQFTKFTDQITKKITLTERNYEEFFYNIQSRKWISQIETNKAFLREINCECLIEQQQQNLNYNISNLRLLKQLLQFQEQRMKQVQNKLSQFQNRNKNQLTVETNNPHQQIIIVLEKILEQLNKINSELQNHSSLFIKKDLKLFLQ